MGRNECVMSGNRSQLVFHCKTDTMVAVVVFDCICGKTAALRHVISGFSNLIRFCFIILCHLYLLSRLSFSSVIHSERIFHSTAVLFHCISK